MEDKIERLSILRLTEENVSEIDDTIVREFPLTIILNDQELVTMLCSPASQKELAVGFLYSEGLIETREEIKNVTLHEGTGVIRVETEGGDELDRETLFNRLITSGCGRGASFYSATDITGKKVESLLQVSVSEILALMRDFQHKSETFRATGGVHSAALCDTSKILVFNEDIGRHNALDKVFGECLLKGIPTDDCLVITSGRISSEILLKVARRNIPILISKSAPTNLGVKMANELGVTLVGFVRGKRANVYTNTWRITRDGK
ncbi:MAG TPA: formate dehydrogenase accessory sulfurtransferase FdhD [Dehalococcoidia bacterium]|nr:formate dehydrogenase accessory sulfurtransferase FdhD [Dehalococcoidia bacterium]